MINTDVFEKTMEEELAKAKDSLDPVAAVSGAMGKASLEFVKTFPIWMRCNVLLNWLANIPDEDIDWDTVNECLRAQGDDLDYNIFDRIESKSALLDLRGDATAAEVPELNLPYFKKTCKCCKNDFTLTRKEINFFLKKGLKVPGKCYDCRKGIKKPTSKVETTVNVDTPAKTAMQIAMEKAGLC